MEQNYKYTNSLIHSSSPYLLQHAHNPVNWFEWGEEAWQKARQENKLVLVSIGYSACHWCHVMEHESFESESTARIMNDHYVCIKVDREERPDIDQVYMTAVQLMTGSGGWPLNCFTLPDGRPIYGGTYFPQVTWNDLLIKLHRFYSENKEQAEQYAEELVNGIHQTELVHPVSKATEFHIDVLDKIVTDWSKSFDSIHGGPNRAPKFPLPNNYEFLLHYAKVKDDKSIEAHLKLTLEKMALGGIYDQLGGGFARYSTDIEWKAPHFEKMLYDNAQLVSLYSNAYREWKDPLYKDVVTQTLEWIEREMTSKEGAFYSALDADSEGMEGKFYVWENEELKKHFQEIQNEKALEIFNAYFEVNRSGLWEHGQNILLRKKSDGEIASQFSMPVEELRKLISTAKTNLMKAREKRIRPGLDDKILASWNALMIKGYSDAYKAFGEKKYLLSALKAAHFLQDKMLSDDGRINHTYRNGVASINGFLEDHAFCIEAFIAIYQCTFEEKWLLEALQLSEYALKHFYDPEHGLFWFTSDLDAALISRKKELSDNVNPASNSSLAKGLYYLGIYFGNSKFTEISKKMISNIVEQMMRYGPGYSNWAMLYLHFVTTSKEIVISGPEALTQLRELNQFYLPDHLIAGSVGGNSSLPLLQNRFVIEKTLIYECENMTCKLPVEKISELQSLRFPNSEK